MNIRIFIFSIFFIVIIPFGTGNHIPIFLGWNGDKDDDL